MEKPYTDAAVRTLSEVLCHRDELVTQVVLEVYIYVHHIT